MSGNKVYEYDQLNPSEQASAAEHNEVVRMRQEANQAMPVAVDGPEEDAPPPSMSAKVALFLCLVASISNQWQRFLIGYANSLCKDEYAGDTKISICAAYPDFSKNYGILSGAAFLISFACFGIFGGALADAMSRKIVICFSIILWSATSVLTGWIDSFAVLYIMRFLLGVFQAFLNPAAYSIISDHFHPEYRTTANAVFGVGIYVGGGLSSISGLMLSSLGWRLTYQITGFIGIGLGVLSIFLLMEPKRNPFEKKQETLVTQASEAPQQRSVISKFCSAMKEMVVNPTCRWVTIGGSFRFFGGYAIAFFSQKYFVSKVFGEGNDQTYFLGNAVVVSICGFLSSMIYARIADRLEKTGNYYSKALVCIICSALGIPFIVLCTCVQFNIYFSLGMLAVEYLVAEGWVPPAITMVVSSVSPENKAVGAGAFLFCATMAGVISTALLNVLQDHYECKQNPERYGYILCAFVVFSYAGSIPFFALAGREYRNVMIRKNAAQNDM